MAQTKSYWQILMQQVSKLTKTITNSLTNIASIFSWTKQNVMLHNTEETPIVRAMNITPRVPTGFSTRPSCQVMREIVAGYRRGLARHLTVNNFPCISIFGTIIKPEQGEFGKMELAAVKAEKEMLVTTLTVARMQIQNMTRRQKELEAEVVKLRDAFKLPELDMEFDAEKFSFDFSDIVCEDDSPKTNIPLDVTPLVVSPRSKKSKLPRPIPTKSKKQAYGAQQALKAKPAY